MLVKLKKIGKRLKAVLITAAVAVVGAVSDAGTSIQNQFGVLVTTLIPVMVGILVTGLAIYGIFTLIKVAKKIFGKVAG